MVFLNVLEEPVKSLKLRIVQVLIETINFNETNIVVLQLLKTKQKTRMCQVNQKRRDLILNLGAQSYPLFYPDSIFITGY